MHSRVIFITSLCHCALCGFQNNKHVVGCITQQTDISTARQLPLLL